MSLNSKGLFIKMYNWTGKPIDCSFRLYHEKTANLYVAAVEGQAAHTTILSNGTFCFRQSGA